KTLGLPYDHRVVFFRSVDDYRRLRRLAGEGRRIAVVGGGFIGTELAAALVQNDTRVTLVFPEHTLGGGVFPPDLARRYRELFEGAGVELLPEVAVTGPRRRRSRRAPDHERPGDLGDRRRRCAGRHVNDG